MIEKSKIGKNSKNKYIRWFNDERYGLQDINLSKRIAKKDAKYMRDTGYTLARVVPDRDNKGKYALYVSAKRRQ